MSLSVEALQLLREHEALLEVLNEDEASPLHLAASKGRTNTVKQLLIWDKCVLCDLSLAQTDGRGQG